MNTVEGCSLEKEGEASREPCLVLPLAAVLLVLGDHDSALLTFFPGLLAIPTTQVSQAVYTHGHSTKKRTNTVQ